MLTKKKLVLLLSPFYLFFILFFVSAIIRSFIASLGYYPILDQTKISLNNYLDVFHDKMFLTICLRTMIFAIISALFACALGLIMANYFNQKNSRVSGFFYKVSQLPVMLPHIFIVLALLQLLSQTGLVPSLLVHLGLIKSYTDFPLILNDQKQIGIFLTYLWKETPYVIVTLILVLRQIGSKYQAVSLNLGASKWQTFWHVTLPLVQPALVNAFIINFSFNFGSYEVPFLLGNQQKELLPVYVYDLYVQGDITQIPHVMSLNLVLSLASIIIAAVAILISRKLPGGHNGGVR
ncbi:ABC transporter permease [Companilactobacillus mishanensis]|uniref:ABC transporter permease subunit n=1 Tax=Companilactobacillus mishanensis TaxID=2486008 RepID=A0A5P0ZG31_9LACO|nr:ABC transporter permease subunit [Companilactobacillus mishanensis]MQS52011.1 ABC transporter permease subunit [Companilactobacillus mishanensis]